MGLLDEFLSGIGETYDTLTGNERIKQRAKGYGDAFQHGLLSALPILAKQPQDITPEDAINSGLLGAIKVFHGSPHKFDAFDMSKIGTGEGAQAYGHGLYFAESPDVAKSYAENVQLPKSFTTDDYKRLVQYKRKQRLGNELSQDEQAAFKDLMTRKQQYEDAVNNQQNFYETSLEWPDAAREASDPLGPQHFLDWEKPYSDQSEKVKEALKSIGFGRSDQTTGRNVYDYLQDVSRKKTDASEYLRSIDIPGIRYLDGGSRGAGDGTYNYVVFDDKIPRIVRRNGLLE